MATFIKTSTRHARPPRSLNCEQIKDVDGRDKPGHDEMKNLPSDRLVVGADLLVRAKHVIDRLENFAHARVRYRALDHDHELRLVRGRPNQAPGAVLDGDAHPVDGDEIANVLAGDFFLFFARGLEMLNHL